MMNTKPNYDTRKSKWKIRRGVKKLVLSICSLLVLWWNISEQIGAEHDANERLHIVTVFDEARTSHARAMITSVLLSTKSTVHVHMVVPDDVRDEMSSWFQTLNSVFKPGTVLLSTYDYRWCVEWTGLLLHISPHIHISAHCKFFLQEILLDVEKALYIDLDVAGVGDISELFNHDETGYIGMSIDTGSLCQRFPEKCAWPIPFSTVVPGGLVCGEQPDKLRYLQPNYTCPEDYGLTPLQFNGGQRCGDLRTALSLSSGLPISWPLGVGDFLQGSHPLRRQAGGMGTMGDFKKISVVICTFELGARFDLVVNNMRKLQSSEMKALVDRIILVWNNPDVAAPEIDGVMVLSATKNSMNNRWILPLPYIRTDAVLVLDDDLLVSKDGILCLYRWWCLYPERPVGTFARRIETRDDSYEYVMSELFGDREIDSKGAYNIILPRIMFLSKNLMSKYAATSKKLLDYVDDQGAHCDDILLNTLSIKDSGTIGLRVVLPRDSVVDCYDIGFQRGLDGFHGLSNTKGGNRTAMRKQCSKFVIEELLTGKELPLATKVGVCAPDWKGKSAGGNSLTEASQVQSDRWKQTLISSELGLGICKLL
ncbi:hypothetical protein SARC_12292 [Sphaeroforma arctica JP610]|uniref:Glycosyl transferase 64 domain-containing protein n=1 Tax=Sphaeroforma arctica JP610 TaxID=667725 RepID=A0A0L0FEI6_9EUKA|nr:hypothetical protein SARC_12292 [Sphaeroforma arctica JP610]KNC75177.1 hypothetical protein SARC_12292 [Sphaeroforma arctica JP610]|eukprot:XP_014149079.1 hypothetical protein SARC_12292 [Sphaeroforma arctica JP610]